MKTMISLTGQDYGRLRGILAERTGSMSRTSEPELKMLENILDVARIVDAADVPGNVVTMNSRVLYEDIASRQQGTVTIVYPTDADPSRGAISVLSPVGGALLGESEGDEVELPLPQGQTRQIRILGVLYQPEAQGHFTL